jgi:hypothetical protein
MPGNDLRLVGRFPDDVESFNKTVPHVWTWIVDETSVIATLRLLFARQAKGKRKLVLCGYFNNNPP